VWNIAQFGFYGDNSVDGVDSGGGGDCVVGRNPLWLWLRLFFKLHTQKQISNSQPIHSISNLKFK